MKRQGYRETPEQRVQNFLCDYADLFLGRQLLVGVSGGQDSICLLHIIYQLQQSLDVKLHVAHLNHQLRGGDSDSDARYVWQLAHRLGIPVTVDQRDVTSYQVEKRVSLEEAAREVRYNFLAEVARNIGTNIVAVGHTTDDHVETVLMHLIRGTGAKGLQGLLPVSRWQYRGRDIAIIRPLLSVSRQETADYCLHHGLEPMIDVTNLSLSPMRNRIRQQLIPLLQDYNPRVSDAILRTARIAGDDYAFLKKESQRLWDDVVQQRMDAVMLHKDKFLKIAPALQRQLLRMAIEGLLGSLKDIETRHIDEIMALLPRPSGKSLSLPQGLVFTVEYDRYLISGDPGVLSPFPELSGKSVLEIPGETLFSGWCITAYVMPASHINDRGSDFAAYFDYDKTGGDIGVRCRRPGDRFQPLGMDGLKKIGEFMIDTRIPRSWRQHVPVVYSSQQILWIVGYRIDDRVKVDKDTERVLCLQFRQSVNAND